MANTHYIQSYYDGSLFEYSKDEKDGFVKHENSKGKISFRRYYNKGVEGELVGVTKKTNKFLNNREELEITLRDGEDYFNITFPILNNDGSQVDDFVEQIIRVLPKLKKGVRYNINNWRMNKGDEINGEIVQYGRSGVTFKIDGVKLEPGLTYQTDNNPNGDIPRIEWKEMAGKNRPTAASKEGKLVFLYDKLTSEVDRLGNSSQNVTQNTAPKAQEEEDDDLPF